LEFRCSDAGDAGCRVLVESGLLARLEHLDLCSGTITDAGARLLSAAPLSGLKHLNLSGNCLTAAGIALLRATGVALQADEQHGVDDDIYLFHGDME
jgi:hypothetical protein